MLKVWASGVERREQQVQGILQGYSAPVVWRLFFGFPSAVPGFLEGWVASFLHEC